MTISIHYIPISRSLVLEVGHRAAQDVDAGVQVLGNRLQHQHVGQQDRYLAVDLHVVVPDHVQHLVEHLDALQRIEGLLVHPSEHGLQVVQVDLVLELLQWRTVVLRDPVNPLGTLDGVALYYLRQKVLEVLLLLLGQPNCHAHVDEDDLHALLELVHHLLHVLLVLVVLLAQPPQQLGVEAVLDHLADEVVLALVEEVQQLRLDRVGVLPYLHQDVARVAVRVHEVVLHEHGKESLGSDVGNHLVHVVHVGLVETDGLPVNILLNQHLVGRLLVGYRETDVAVQHQLVETVNVPLLLQEGQLLRQYLLQRVLSNRDVEYLRQFREHTAENEQQIDVPLQIPPRLRMTHLHRHHLTVQLSLVHLTHRPRCNGRRIELLKHLPDLFTVHPLDRFLGVLKFMLGRVFPKNGELSSHVLTDDIPSVTQVLERLYPHNSRPSHRTQEDTQPPVPRAAEKIERQTQDCRGEDDAQLNETQDVLGSRDQSAVASRTEKGFVLHYLVLGRGEFAMVQVVEDRCAGQRDQRVLYSLDVPECLGAVCSDDRERLHYPQGQLPHRHFQFNIINSHLVIQLSFQGLMPIIAH